MNYHKLILLCLILLITSCKNDGKDALEKNNIKDSRTEIEDVSVSASYSIETDESIVKWIGSKPGGEHYGEIKIKNGELKFEDGQLIAGKFTVDMNTINVMDLEGDQKTDLENHLKGNIKGKEDHFFNVEKYPEAMLVIKSSEEYGNLFKVYGNLTIRGITNPIEFRTKLEFSKDNQSIKMKTENFEIDRTKWGIEYMSKSVFDDLKERFIDDMIVLEATIKANKS